MRNEPSTHSIATPGHVLNALDLHNEILRSTTARVLHKGLLPPRLALGGPCTNEKGALLLFTGASGRRRLMPRRRLVVVPQRQHHRRVLLIPPHVSMLHLPRDVSRIFLVRDAHQLTGDLLTACAYFFIHLKNEVGL